MDALAGRGLIDEASRRDFARNTLVLVVPQDSQLNLTAFDGLADARVQRIAVGNPKTVPAGQYAEQVFNNTNLRDKLQAKLVLAEDVRQVLDYVMRGEVEAGIVYATDARSAGVRVRVVATAAEDSHAPILYPIAVIKDSKQKQPAQEFVNLVNSPEGQAVLRKYGFASAGER
jgi:molybdate transport system substrate-binding protein